MRIVYYPQNFDGPGCYRCIYPGTQLSAHGGHSVKVGDHEVLHQDATSSAIHFHLDTKVDADLVVLQLPGQPEHVQFQRELQRRGIRVVVDMDDDFLNLPKYNPAKKVVDVSDPRGPKAVLLSCLRHADAVTVTTPALRDSVARVTDAPIYVLRNFLDWRCFRNVHPVYESRDWDRPRIGYMGMAHWHAGDLEVLRPWFGKWLEANPGVDFITVGDPSIHDLLGVPKPQRLCVEKFSFRLQKIARYCATMDVGLVPLAQNPFNEAKSHLKGMEYAGVGVPCLASPTESYRDWWLSERSEEGRSGFLCARPEEWVRALDLLVGDGDLRRKIGMNARAQASVQTYQAHWRLWDQAYEEVCAALVAA